MALGDYYYDQWAVSGYVQVGIWCKKGGTWSLFATEDVQVYYDVGGSGGGRQTVPWTLQGSYAMGAGVTDIGVTIEATDDTAAATYLAMSWSASATTSERTATPGGEQAAAVVRP